MTALIALALLVGLIAGGAAGQMFTLAVIAALHTLAEDPSADLEEEPRA